MPSRPWEDLANYYLGPLPSGHYLLVIIDYYSRLQKIFPLKSTSSSNTVSKLKETFADFGVPKSITADNATSFTSKEFQEFCKDYGIQLINTIPYWPSMNGEVKRQNRSVLKRLIISQNTKGSDWQSDLCDYLLMYHSIAHPATLKSPMELMTNRKPRDKLPMVQQESEFDLEIRDKDKIYREKGKQYADERRHARPSDIGVEDMVLVKNFHKHDKLSPNFQPEPHPVEKVKGGDVLVTGTESGVTRRRYLGHLKKISGSDNYANEGQEETSETQEKEDSVERKDSAGKKRALETVNPNPDEIESRPKRVRKAPVRYSN